MVGDLVRVRVFISNPTSPSVPGLRTYRVPFLLTRYTGYSTTVTDPMVHHLLPDEIDTSYLEYRKIPCKDYRDYC